jgi:hypothetical protein
MDTLNRKVNQLRQKSKTDDEIRQELLDRGHSAREINSALTSKKTTKPWPGAVVSINKSIKQISKDPLPGIYVILLITITTAVLQLAIKHPPFKLQKISFLQLVNGAETILLYPYIVRYQLSLAKDKRIPASDLIKNGLATYLWIILAAVMGILMFMVGAVLLFIPLIWFIPWLYLLFFPIIDKKFNTYEALQYVFSLAKGNLGKLWAIIAYGLIVLVLLSIGLSKALILLTPLSFCVSLVVSTSLASLYLWLKQN